jgi:ferredoxin-nitrate reductase
MPELQRVRNSFVDSDLFIVAQVGAVNVQHSGKVLTSDHPPQDIFPTETTALADVVLPGAQWAEKTGCQLEVPSICRQTLLSR